MLFLVGEKLRTKSEPVGNKTCALCRSEQPFTEQLEMLWFTFFSIPVLPIERFAHYWRCEKCYSSYSPHALDLPSQVPVIKLLVTYILVGYNQHQHQNLAAEICLKLMGFELTETEYRRTVQQLTAGTLDIVEHVRGLAAGINGTGKQQIVEAAFLMTHACCELQYEDRLRVNRIGNALGVGLEFVDYCIAQTRKNNYYGVRRLVGSEQEV